MIGINSTYERKKVGTYLQVGVSVSRRLDGINGFSVGLI